MKIGGFIQFSLSEFHGRTSCVLFTQGCNFKCPYCHNDRLIPTHAGCDSLIAESTVFDFLIERRGRIDGVVISGGEPTIQEDLEQFAHEVRRMGIEMMIETNGSRPAVIRKLIDSDLLDFVAMDVKAPFRIYDRLTGGHAPIDALKESIAAIVLSGLPHEFRTTLVRPLLSDRDIEEIRRIIPSGSPHRLQTFRPENALDPTLRKQGDGRSLYAHSKAHQRQTQ